MADTPWLLLFPYLPVCRELNVGPWKLLPARDFTGPWRSASFRQRSMTIIRSHVDRSGRPLSLPSILVDGETGADGVLPDPEQVDALQLALGFGVLDAVPPWHSDAELALIAAQEAARYGKDEAAVLSELAEARDNAQHDTWRVGTADNAEPFFWPVHPTGGIARQYGSIINTTVGGGGRGVAGKVIPPSELHLPGSLSLDAERVSALYSIFVKAPADEEALKLRESVRWLLQAWRNTPSLLQAQRVVLLRTAYEVLLGDHGTTTPKERLARRLTERFERLPPEERELIRAGDLLWQPAQPHDLQVQGVNQSLGPFSDLERWFIGLSVARNKIVHEGNLTLLADGTAGSVYAGPYWRVASRVLRDVILVEAHRWGFAGVWDDSFGRAGREVIARLASAE
jgi:hypothetical protein